MATIKGKSDFTEEEETVVAEKLKEAMDICGTKEDAIIEILVGFDSFQRRRIAKAFGQAYGKPLDEALKDELSGDFEETIISMLRSPRELDAAMLHDAIAGVGTDERMLLSVLVPRDSGEIEEIKECYKNLYDSDMLEDLQSDTSGYFKRLMFSLCTAYRQVELADEEHIAKETQKLIEAGVGQCGTDEAVFNQVLCLNSYATLDKIFDRYRMERGVEIEQDLDDELSGDTLQGYKDIVQLVRGKNEFFARLLYDATTGAWGTEDSELIRLIVSRSEIDLKDINETFTEKYGQSLSEVVASECSGDYKQTLLSLIEGEFVAKE